MAQRLLLLFLLATIVSAGGVLAEVKTHDRGFYWELLGTNFAGLGQHEKAIAMLTKALEFRRSPRLALGTILILRRHGQHGAGQG